MPPVILHVEDDLALRAVVVMTFQRLGFRGTTIYATTIAQARHALDQAATDGRTFDLILSDMHLPDGTGLELVKFVRASPTWSSTPMLILSGDLDPKTVDRAYALGANAYIDKSPGGRSTIDVVTTLYGHWLHDVVRPHGHAEPTTATIARTMAICLRIANLYVRLADRFGDSSSESAFWVSQALIDSNLANLLAFLKQQTDGVDLATGLLDEIAQIDQKVTVALGALEHDLETAQLPRDEIYRKVLDFLGLVDVTVLARAVAALFPITPAAATALQDFLLTSIGDVSAWIELHAVAPELHAHASKLRSTLPVHEAQHAS